MVNQYIITSHEGEHNMDPDSPERAEYDQARRELYAAFSRMSRGSKALASRDIGKSPSSVSSVIKGNMVNRPVLNRLIEWVRHHEQEQKSA